jgi:Tfp pilus assembly protein PilW
MLTRARRRAADEAGVGLVELMVFLVLASLVGAVYLGGMRGGFRTTTTIEQRSAATAELTFAVERMAREIRAADPIHIGTAGPNGMQVRVFREGQCHRFIYEVSGNQLRQAEQTPLTPPPPALGTPSSNYVCYEPAPSSPAPASLARTVLVDALVTDAPVFTYRNAQGQTMNFLTSPRPSEDDIAEVRIRLRRRVGGHVVETSTDVTLRNRNRLVQ